MRNLMIAAAAVTALFTGSASAADMAPRPYVKAPPIVQVYNWTGFYIGGNVGGQWLDSSYDASYPTLALLGSRGLRDTSVIGGGQIGYNWQFSPNWLLGIEGDISYADHNTGGLVISTGVPTDHIDGNARLRTQGAIRGRLGWTSNAWLLYAVGGVAFGQTDTTLSIVRDGVGADSRTNSDTRVGWTVGAGVEYMMAPNWILGVEYRYTDLGRADVTVPAGTFPAAHGAAFGSADYRTNDVRARVSYKFGGPVVAKY
jgi:outer membrane immunogenic protein